MSSVTLALFIFGICYLIIMTERIHKTIVALSGAALMIALGVVSQDEAFYSHEFGVDYSVVFLLIGMMVIINIIRETGLFEVLAIWAAKKAQAKPFRLMVLLAVLTAVFSAMLDNVTTVLLMAPVTLAISKRLELNPISFLLCEAMSSNIGGTATLVGDPPNIMISSKAELGYLDFLFMLGPIALVIMVVFLGMMWLLFGRNMTVAPHLRDAVLALNPKDAIRDQGLLRRCLWAFGAVNLGFAFHSFIHLEPATVALLGASAFMLLGHARGRSNETEEDEISGRSRVEDHFLLHRVVHPRWRLGESRGHSISRRPARQCHGGQFGRRDIRSAHRLGGAFCVHGQYSLCCGDESIDRGSCAVPSSRYFGLFDSRASTGHHPALVGACAWGLPWGERHDYRSERKRRDCGYRAESRLSH